VVVEPSTVDPLLLSDKFPVDPTDMPLAGGPVYVADMGLTIEPIYICG
jgi:hypothetical protein